MRQPIAPTGRIDIVTPGTRAVVVSLPTARPRAEAVDLAECMVRGRGYLFEYVPLDSGTAPAALRAPSEVNQ